MPRPARENERIREERREDILRAARRVFAERGLAAAKMSDIAAEAGLSYGLVYHYFKSKDAVYAAIVERAVHRALDDTRAALEGKGSPVDRLRTVTRRMLRAVRDEPETLLLILQTTCQHTSPGARDAIERYGQQAFDNLRALIREGQRAGELGAGDPAELAYLFFAAIQGLAVSRALEGPDAKRRMPRVETILRIFHR